MRIILCLLLTVAACQARVRAPAYQPSGSSHAPGWFSDLAEMTGWGGSPYPPHPAGHQPLILGRFGLGFDRRTQNQYGLSAPLTLDMLHVVGRDYWRRLGRGYGDFKYPSQP